MIAELKVNNLLSMSERDLDTHRLVVNDMRRIAALGWAPR